MKNNIPERGVDYDDFKGFIYLEDEKGLSNVQIAPRFCPANENHGDDFIGLAYGGYSTKDIPESGIKRGQYVDDIMYPTRNFTEADLNALFNKVELETGDVKYTPKTDILFSELFVRVCYKTPNKPNPKEDTIKWAGFTDGNTGELFTLSGPRRQFKKKDAEQ